MILTVVGTLFGLHHLLIYHNITEEIAEYLREYTIIICSPCPNINNKRLKPKILVYSI